MVSEREVEKSMLEIFPTCPICESNRGYDVSGFLKNYVQCRNCKTKWVSAELGAGKKVEFLKLWEPSKDGQGNELYNKKKSVKFWRNYKANLKNTESTIESDYQTLRNKTITSLKNFKGYELSNLAQLSMLFSANTAEHAMTKLLKAIVDQNNIMIMQNELILRTINKKSNSDSKENPKS